MHLTFPKLRSLLVPLVFLQRIQRDVVIFDGCFRTCKLFIIFLLLLFIFFNLYFALEKPLPAY